MKNHLICAIDVNNFASGYDIAKIIAPYVGGIKLGLEFFSCYGISGIKKFIDIGLPVFLDLKFYDIPNTVYKASLAVRDLGIDMFTVHVSGGLEMLSAALKAFEGTKTRILGVTILTSMHSDPQSIVSLAKIAKKASLHGIICPTNAISAVREEIKGDFLIVVPGIRDVNHDVNDHKQASSPKSALDAGADYLVIGRPITDAKDPVKATKDIILKCS